METINYKDLEWYVINENDKEKLLFLKDCFTDELMLKYFKGVVDKYIDVSFSDSNNLWWKDSHIRNVLNNRFLIDLDKNDLNIMKTTFKTNNMKFTTKDYVRLITKEEVEKLNKAILYTSRENGYWTMSPFCYDCFERANGFYVRGSGDSRGTLSSEYVKYLHGVRPVISLKNKPLDSGLIVSDEEEMIRELKRAIML